MKIISHIFHLHIIKLSQSYVIIWLTVKGMEHAKTPE
nr:MAG TPA: hypothetical protein [Caudoviricetes sp.]